MNDNENIQPIQMGESVPPTGEMHQGAEPGTQGADGPVQENLANQIAKDIKGEIDHVTPIKGGRRFVLKDGGTACLTDDGEIWVNLDEENPKRFTEIINRWIKLSGWKPNQPTK